MIVDDLSCVNMHFALEFKSSLYRLYLKGWLVGVWAAENETSARQLYGDHYKINWCELEAKETMLS